MRALVLVAGLAAALAGLVGLALSRRGDDDLRDLGVGISAFAVVVGVWVSTMIVVS